VSTPGADGQAASLSTDGDGVHCPEPWLNGLLAGRDTQAQLPSNSIPSCNVLVRPQLLTNLSCTCSTGAIAQLSKHCILQQPPTAPAPTSVVSTHRLLLSPAPHLQVHPGAPGVQPVLPAPPRSAGCGLLQPQVGGVVVSCVCVGGWGGGEAGLQDAGGRSECIH
jgi:hypothetical protein